MRYCDRPPRGWKCYLPLGHFGSCPAYPTILTKVLHPIRFKGLRTKPDLTQNTASPVYPHCDQNVLHAPGKCVYCDMRPDLQQARKLLGINFTGEHDKDKHQDLAEQHRSLEKINRWGGNRARPRQA